MNGNSLNDNTESENHNFNTTGLDNDLQVLRPNGDSILEIGCLKDFINYAKSVMLDVITAINHIPESPFLPLELAGAASDTDSEVSQGGMADHAADEDGESKDTGRPKGRKAAVIERLESLYVEDPDRETGAVSKSCTSIFIAKSTEVTLVLNPI